MQWQAFGSAKKAKKLYCQQTGGSSDFPELSGHYPFSGVPPLLLDFVTGEFITNRFRRYRRKEGYYVHDGETGKQESLRIHDKQEAMRLLVAKNEAQDNRLLNLKIAEAHLAAYDLAMNTRLWKDVMKYITDREGEVKASTLICMEWTFASRPFDLIHNKKLVTTTSDNSCGC